MENGSTRKPVSTTTNPMCRAPLAPAMSSATSSAPTRDGFLIWVTSLLLHTDQGNVTTFIDSNGAIAGPDNVSDYWVAPARLAQLQDTNTAGLRILRGLYPLDGVTHRVVRIQRHSNAGWAQNTFDLDTGLCIVSSSSTQGSSILMRNPGNTTGPGAGNTQLTFMKFVTQRRTTLPGPGERFPDWVRRLRGVNYSGERTAAIPSTPVPSIAIQARYEILSNTDTYLTARLSVTEPAAVPIDRIIPAGVFGSLWMNPTDSGAAQPQPDARPRPGHRGADRGPRPAERACLSCCADALGTQYARLRSAQRAAHICPTAPADRHCRYGDHSSPGRNGLAGRPKSHGRAPAISPLRPTF